MTQTTQTTMTMTTTQKREIELDHKQNAFACIFALVSVASCYTKMYFVETSVTFFIYYLYDLTKVTPIYKLHHTLALLFLSELYYLYYNGKCIDPFLDMCLYLEITTPFMILSLYYNHISCKLLFFILFSYFRIYKGYYFLVNHSVFTLYPIYLLNLFWFIKMIRKMNVFNDPKYILLCEQISSYINFLNFYFFKSNIQGFAILCLSISSYLFHQKKYQILKYNKPSTEIVPYIIANTFCIHLRSILCIKSHLCIPFYIIPFHIISFITKLYSNELDSILLTSSPMIVDLILNFDINVCFNIYIIFLVLYIKPLRNMNFIFFNLLLLVQSYIKL
jgi:hypothetical protein